MGLFDEVAFTCPTCNALILHQSKAGECILSTFDSDAVSAEVAQDILGEHAYCNACNEGFQIITHTPIATVSLTLKP